MGFWIVGNSVMFHIVMFPVAPPRSTSRRATHHTTLQRTRHNTTHTTPHNTTHQPHHAEGHTTLPLPTISAPATLFNESETHLRISLNRNMPTSFQVARGLQGYTHTIRLMRTIRQTGNWPRPMHSGPCCAALPLPLRRVGVCWWCVLVVLLDAGCLIACFRAVYTYT